MVQQNIHHFIQELRRQLQDADAKLERERERTFIIERQAMTQAAATNFSITYQSQAANLAQNQNMYYSNTTTTPFTDSPRPLRSEVKADEDLDARIRQLEKQREESRLRRDELKQKLQSTPTATSSSSETATSSSGTTKLVLL